jgi:hypothetical protein
LFDVLKISAQNFQGFVKKDDSTSAAIYQAIIQIEENSKPLEELKTYFDGSYKFHLNKNKTYRVKVVYPGYTDTSFVFTTDKSANPSAQNISVKLKKDGMRLTGTLRSREENFPIKEATVILRNVLTKKENRITTSLDGHYNFKLEYETNYRISIDKNSAGILNKYKDTAFYISTIGITLPLDYKLDIMLEELSEPEKVSPKK